jgi:AraC family carnitine catabolism transcriptional activator
MVLANWLGQEVLYQWDVLSGEGGPVRATNGMLIPTQPIDCGTHRYATIFVIASFDAKAHAGNRKIRAWLQRASVYGAQIGGIETGTELLAAASLLDEHPAAVHWDNLEGFRETYPRVRASTQLYTLESRLLTCAGALAIPDLMLAWIAQHQGAAIAAEISQHLLHANLRGATEGQLGASKPDGGQGTANSMSEQVTRAIHLMRESITAPVSCESIAASVGLSKRQLERKFKLATAMAPGRYYVNLRVSTAHQLLQQTGLTVSQVAVATGFDSLEHFSRMYKARFGRPPSRDRAQSWEAPVMRLAPLVPFAQ